MRWWSNIWSSQQKEFIWKEQNYIRLEFTTERMSCSNIFVKGISLFVAYQPTRTSEVLCSLSILLPEGPSARFFWAQSRVAWSPEVNTTWWYGRDSRDAEALHRKLSWRHMTETMTARDPSNLHCRVLDTKHILSEL